MPTNLLDFQNQILLWIEQQGFVTWNEIKENCRNLVEFLPQDEKKIYGVYPEYKIFMPLFRNGCVEICQSDDNSTQKTKNGFHFIWNYQRDEIPKINFDSLKVLKAFPTIKDLIKTFPDAKDEISKSALMSKCDILNGYKYINSENGATETGIYKKEDLAWYNEYLFDKKDSSIKKIPNFETLDYESLNIARCYVRKETKQDLKFFNYDEKREKLKINNYSYYRNLANDFPILIMRSLICLDKNQLKNELFYGDLNEKIEYSNVSLPIYKELKRIFGE